MRFSTQHHGFFVGGWGRKRLFSKSHISTSVVQGGTGNDRIFGGSGNETLWGDGKSATCRELDSVNDIINGSFGAGHLYGDGGNDIMCSGESGRIMAPRIKSGWISKTGKYVDWMEGGEEMTFSTVAWTTTSCSEAPAGTNYTVGQGPSV